MIHLQIVSFEQAKRLKELGFHMTRSTAWYMDTTLAGHNPKELQESVQVHIMSKDIITAPTVALALKWLRDKKDVYVGVLPELEDVEVYINGKLMQKTFNSYEEAESAALDAALKLL